MKGSTVVVVTKKQARFFGIEGVASLPAHGLTRLVERRTLNNEFWDAWVNAQKIDTRRGDYPSAGPASAPGASGQQASKSGFVARSSFSDAEQSEEAQAMRRFAIKLGEIVTEFVQSEAPERLIIVSGPKLLGHIRPELPKQILNNLKVLEVNKDFSHLKDHEIHDALAKDGLLPKRNVDPTHRATGQNQAS